MFTTFAVLFAAAAVIALGYQLATMVCDADDREEEVIYGKFE